MCTLLQRLFRYKAWANDQLLTALAKLGDNSPITTLAIKALSHAYIVDRIFLAHLQGIDHAFNSVNLTQMPSLHSLSDDIRASDQEYLEYIWDLSCDSLRQEVDFAFTDGARGRMSREEILMHVIIHGAGHGGQVSAVMLLNSVPPATDGFTTYLHTAEAQVRRRAAA
jgi:uncharacterized damage-inducible protein DinB